MRSVQVRRFVDVEDLAVEVTRVVVALAQGDLELLEHVVEVPLEADAREEVEHAA
jgi:hypothetical protein